MEYSEKQRQIMDVALALFADHGYHKTSIRDIARAAEVNVAMVSYYFGSKDKLLEAIFIHRFGTMREILRDIIYEKTHSPIEKVEKFIDIFIDMLVQHQLFHRLMMRESSVIKEGPLFDMIYELKTTNRRLVEKAVKNGQRLGVFRKDVDVFFMSSVLIGSVNQNLANHRYEMEHTQWTVEEKEVAKKKRINALRKHLKRMFIAYLTFDEGQ
ncbi:TetR family transcriptional regulator [Parapedobacter lycopersici]|uniref:TetR/AcrR family transcriptional regulator n=1 Tax=Parapedobacter lycopersici TaxID=1864939 RepID=UPI0033418EC0